MGNELGINEKVLRKTNVALGPEKFELPPGIVLTLPVSIDFVLAEEAVQETHGQKKIYLIYLETPSSSLPPRYPNSGIYVERCVINSFPCDITNREAVNALYDSNLKDLANSKYKWPAKYRLYLKLD